MEIVQCCRCKAYKKITDALTQALQKVDTDRLRSAGDLPPMLEDWVSQTFGKDPWNVISALHNNCGIMDCVFESGAVRGDEE